MSSIPAQQNFRQAQWRILLLTMFCYLFFYTGRQTFGFAIPGIEEELGISKTQLGWASTALLWCYAIGQSVNGNLGDKFGGRRMMSMGAAFSCGLNWLVSIGSSYFAIAGAWGANGFAQSMAWAPGSRVLSNWWGYGERGRVYGLYVFSAGLGSVLAFAACTLILQMGLDWRWIFRLPVLLLLFGGVVYFLFARDRPEDLGYAPPKDPIDEEEVKSKSAKAKIPQDNESSFSRYASVLSNPRLLIASLAIGFQNLVRYGLLVWVPVHFLGENWKDPTSNTKWIAIALPIGMALGAMASGWISDRLFGGNRWRVICLFMALAGVCSLGMFYIPKSNAMVAVPLLFLTGFFAYGPQSAFWALCPDLVGHRRVGTATGIMNTSAYLFAGFGEPLIGWSIDHYNNTALVFAIVACSCMLAAGISPLIRR